MGKPLFYSLKAADDFGRYEIITVTSMRLGRYYGSKGNRATSGMVSHLRGKFDNLDDAKKVLEAAEAKHGAFDEMVTDLRKALKVVLDNRAREVERILNNHGAEWLNAYTASLAIAA